VACLFIIIKERFSSLESIVMMLVGIRLMPLELMLSMLDNR
jgi:hypothetical protein